MTADMTTAQRGFTLIELMVIVVIVGILASVAYPSFRDQALRASRSDAKAALVDAASRQEQYFLDNKTYTSDVADLNLAAETENGYYAVAIDAATAACPVTTCFTARATPLGRQADDTRCAALTLDSRGTKSATGTEPESCW